jgi:hypothetical protein
VLAPDAPAEPIPTPPLGTAGKLIGVSSAAPNPGETLRVSVTDFCRSSSVTISFDGDAVALVTDDDGRAETTFVVPDRPGDEVVVSARAAAPPSAPDACFGEVSTTITIAEAAVRTTDAKTSGRGVARLVQVAAALLLTTLGLVIVLRRNARRSAGRSTRGSGRLLDDQHR